MKPFRRGAAPTPRSRDTDHEDHGNVAGHAGHGNAARVYGIPYPGRP
ncbi:hypothetical protein [Streptomyces axinellae]